MSNKIATFDQIKLDASVAMEDVVSSFISRYENNLFSRKKELSSEIDTLRKTREAYEDALIAGVDVSVYEQTNKELGFRTKAKATRVVDALHDQSPKRAFYVAVKVEFKFHHGHREFEIDYKVPLNATQKGKLLAFKESSATLTDELRNILASISDMSRKERQVRGRIAEKKLQDSGMGALLNDKQMLELIAL